MYAVHFDPQVIRRQMYAVHFGPQAIRRQMYVVHFDPQVIISQLYKEEVSHMSVLLIRGLNIGVFVYLG